MNINEYSFPFSSQESNNDINKLENKQNEMNATFNYVLQNSQDIKQMNFGIKEKENENEIEELDETDNLKYKDNINLNPFLQQRLDSFDSKAHFKYSIDIPNVSKQRLHEYLNDDLLNALDGSPNIPKLNSGLSNEYNDNNANNDLLGFSLYSQPDNNNQNLNNKNENNINNLSDFSNINNNFNDNNNYINIQNYNYSNNNNLNYNINNPQIFIHSKLRNNEYNNQDKKIKIKIIKIIIIK